MMVKNVWLILGGLLGRRFGRLLIVSDLFQLNLFLGDVSCFCFPLFFLFIICNERITRKGNGKWVSLMQIV